MIQSEIIDFFLILNLHKVDILSMNCKLVNAYF